MLSEGQLKKLQGQLRTALSRVPENGIGAISLDGGLERFCSSLETVLPKGTIFSDIINFIYREIYRSASETSTLTSIRLVEGMSGQDLEQFASDIVDYVATIPHQIEIELPLFEKVSKKLVGTCFPIATNLYLEAKMDGLMFQYPALKLVVRSKGFCTSSSKYLPFSNSLLTYKAVVFFYTLDVRLAKMLELSKTPLNTSYYSTEAVLRHATLRASERSLFVDIPLESNLSTLVYNLSDEVRNPENIPNELKMLIEADTKYTKHIYSGISWYIDAVTNDNETMSFIQACIGLEAILGDDNKDRISATLADRCVYLVTNKISERKKLKEDFNQLYRVRGKLVHGVKRQLSDSEQFYYYFAISMLQRVICVEVSKL